MDTATTRYEPSFRPATPDETRALLADDHDEFVDTAVNSMLETATAGSLVTTLGDGKKPALRYDTIRDIVQMNRRLAEASLQSACAEMVSARDADARVRALQAIEEAQHALLYASNAEMSLISSETAFRNSSLYLVTGNEADADAASKEAAARLAETAAATAKLGPAVTKSRVFGALLGAMYAADNAVAVTERRTVEFKASVQRRAENFSASMVEVAGRIRAFAKVVMNFPKVAREVAQQKGVQVAQASVLVSRNLSNGLRGWFAEKAEAVAGKVKESAAWQFVSDQSAKASHAGRAVADHATAAVLLAGSAVSAVGGAYQEHLSQVHERRHARP